jgi:hypothetical protein
VLNPQKTASLRTHIFHQSTQNGASLYFPLIIALIRQETASMRTQIFQVRTQNGESLCLPLIVFIPQKLCPSARTFFRNAHKIVRQWFPLIFVNPAKNFVPAVAHFSGTHEKWCVPVYRWFLC